MCVASGADLPRAHRYAVTPVQYTADSITDMIAHLRGVWAEVPNEFSEVAAVLMHPDDGICCASIELCECIAHMIRSFRSFRCQGDDSNDRDCADRLAAALCGHVGRRFPCARTCIAVSVMGFSPRTLQLDPDVLHRMALAELRILGIDQAHVLFVLLIDTTLT